MCPGQAQGYILLHLHEHVSKLAHTNSNYYFQTNKLTMFQKTYVTYAEGTLPISWLTKELIFQARFTWSGWNIYYNQMHSAWVSYDTRIGKPLTELRLKNPHIQIKNAIYLYFCSRHGINNTDPNSCQGLSLYMASQCSCSAEQPPVSECTTSEVKLSTTVNNRQQQSSHLYYVSSTSCYVRSTVICDNHPSDQQFINPYSCMDG